jgi:hypothetical protein
VSGRKPKFKSWPLRSGEIARQAIPPDRQESKFQPDSRAERFGGECSAVSDTKNWWIHSYSSSPQAFLRFEKPSHIKSKEPVFNLKDAVLNAVRELWRGGLFAALFFVCG